MKAPAPTAEPTPFERELAEFFGEAPGGATADGVPDHVTFRVAEPGMTPLAAAEDLVRHLRARNKAKSHLSYPTRVNARTHTAYSGAVTARVGWQGGKFHTVKFVALDDGRMLVSHKVVGGHELSSLIHGWLTEAARFTDVEWRTADAFR